MKDLSQRLLHTIRKRGEEVSSGERRHQAIIDITTQAMWRETVRKIKKTKNLAQYKGTTITSTRINTEGGGRGWERWTPFFRVSDSQEGDGKMEEKAYTGVAASKVFSFSLV